MTMGTGPRQDDTRARAWIISSPDPASSNRLRLNSLGLFKEVSLKSLTVEWLTVEILTVEMLTVESITVKPLTVVSPTVHFESQCYPLQLRDSVLGHHIIMSS